MRVLRVRAQGSKPLRMIRVSEQGWRHVCHQLYVTIFPAPIRRRRGAWLLHMYIISLYSIDYWIRLRMPIPSRTVWCDLSLESEHGKTSLTRVEVKLHDAGAMVRALCPPALTEASLTCSIKRSLECKSRFKASPSPIPIVPQVSRNDPQQIQQNCSKRCSPRSLLQIYCRHCTNQQFATSDDANSGNEYRINAKAISNAGNSDDDTSSLICTASTKVWGTQVNPSDRL
jgi:hypothetical protein